MTTTPGKRALAAALAAALAVLASAALARNLSTKRYVLIVAVLLVLLALLLPPNAETLVDESVERPEPASATSSKIVSPLSVPNEVARDSASAIASGALRDDPCSWPQRPLLMWRDARARWLDVKGSGAALPINNSDAPIFFETRLFKGWLVQRVRGRPDSDDAYFRGRRRYSQSLVVGVFKQRLRCDRVFTGQEFDRPFTHLPSWVRAGLALAKRISPGMEADLLGPSPTMLAPLAATAQTIWRGDAARFDVHALGALVASRDVDECFLRGAELRRGSGSTSSGAAARRAYFSKRANARLHYFDRGELGFSGAAAVGSSSSSSSGGSGTVYAFDMYQDKMDLGAWAIKLAPPASLLVGGAAGIPLAPYIGTAPIRVLARVERGATGAALHAADAQQHDAAVQRRDEGRDTALLWSFDLLHESGAVIQ